MDISVVIGGRLSFAQSLAQSRPGERGIHERLGEARFCLKGQDLGVQDVGIEGDPFPEPFAGHAEVLLGLGNSLARHTDLRPRSGRARAGIA